ncbi:hypothetical protein [Lyngbya confervoides]|uniref:Uncharacterized protein n=1 Tax=Lyngbya confervoides BDU141951 TaxID=1574623 RepID=A0ABD4T4A5_9CYAN|nr:hypothetical protein [Lyngbya confervoides]MCM1983263.1 hypothetical protein [Lyngbya confervoides BDU141951]
MVNAQGPNSGVTQPGQIQIDQLNLRIPGADQAIGHRVAAGVAQDLAEQIPADLQRQIGAMNLRVSVALGTSEMEMSRAIAGAIATALQRGDAAGVRAAGGRSS